MKINYNLKTIVMTATEAKKASKFGTEEYKALIEAKREFPTFEITVAKTRTKRTEDMLK